MVISIAEIETLVRKLNPEDQERFNRIFTLQTITSSFKGSQSQTIVKVYDKIAGLEIFFNKERSKRPRSVVTKDFKLNKFIEEHKRKDLFCRPKEATPEDIFGRVETKYAITAKNAFPFSKHHGLLIFKEHHPLHFTETEFQDYFKASRQWFKKVDEIDSKITWRQITWGVMPRSGASQIHGHMQLLADEKPTVFLLDLEHHSAEYSKIYSSNYFSDLFLVHKSLGLAKELNSLKIITTLTPAKEKGLMVIGDTFEEAQVSILYKILRTFIDELKTESFNMTFEFRFKNSKYLPYVIIKFVDRGKNQDTVSDFGPLEVFNHTAVIATDPFWLAEKLLPKI